MEKKLMQKTDISKKWAIVQKNSKSQTHDTMTIPKRTSYGPFIHKNNKLLVVCNDTNSTITFDVCRNWITYFKNPKKAEWLLSLHREKSNEKNIKTIFIMIVKKS